MPSHPSKPILPPINHFNYDEMEDCCCMLCTEYNAALLDYSNKSTNSPCSGNLVGKYHQPDCRCSYCQERIESLENLRAATAKRDIYSELSYLARNSASCVPFLQWVQGVIRFEGERRPAVWWSRVTYNRPLSSWISQWQERFLPEHLWAASGIY